jgi:hypothetical protein
MLDLANFGANPYASEFGASGVYCVGHGKADNSSPPKRHSVLTVWVWEPGVIDQWTAEVRPLLATGANQALRPSARAERIGLQQLNQRFAVARDELGPAAGIDCHSLRRSYITYLIQDERDPLFACIILSSLARQAVDLCVCVAVVVRDVADEGTGGPFSTGRSLLTWDCAHPLGRACASRGGAMFAEQMGMLLAKLLVSSVRRQMWAFAVSSAVTGKDALGVGPRARPSAGSPAASRRMKRDRTGVECADRTAR